MRINSGIHKGRQLQVPKGGNVRPTFTKLKQAVFNICSQTLVEADFLDLFAGAGGMGLEALSRGARFATFVEQNKGAQEAISANIALLHEEGRSHLIRSDVATALHRFAKSGKTFDIIFADPPYGQGLSDEVLLFVDTHPLLKKGGELFLEDVMEKQKEAPPLTTLTLQSERRMGRSCLRHYIYE